MGYGLAPNTSIWQQSIEVMVKHLPPSSAKLHLLDFSSHSTHVTQALHKIRADIVTQNTMTNPPTQVETLRHNLQQITYADNSIDAITAHSSLYLLNDPRYFLAEVLRVLRPGGRLILLDPADGVSNWAAVKNIFSSPQNGTALIQWHRTAKRYQRFSLGQIARLLEDNGFARILAERTLNGWAILSRGEKPYAANTSTIDRVAIGASDSNELGILQGDEILSVEGRFIHLLIHQTPNVPVWKAKSGEIEWSGAAFSVPSDEQPIAFAFTSLPKAVSFMQGAVLEGKIQNINKIAKFNKTVASQWDFKILLNPTLAIFEEFAAASIVFLSISPESAEAPDE